MILAFLGPPAAGKGTQSRLLADAIGAHLIDVGAYLRRHRSQKTKLGKLINSLTSKGENVPGSVLMQVIGEDILKHKDGVIIDNFLRDANQVRVWFKFAKANQLALDAVIHLKADFKICQQRMLKRRQVEQRYDDSLDIFIKRYRQVYQANIDQIISALTGVKIIEIDASQSIGAVYNNIVKALKRENLWPTE